MTDIKNIERYLYDEADLLDNPDLDSWIKLYSEDGTYWMPVT
jgi:3-phenylpropionate/cinnamic acid dioxygenase small subunit